MEELEPLIDEAISTLKIVKVEKRGKKAELPWKQRPVLLLLKHPF